MIDDHGSSLHSQLNNIQKKKTRDAHTKWLSQIDSVAMLLTFGSVVKISFYATVLSKHLHGTHFILIFTQQMEIFVCLFSPHENITLRCCPNTKLWQFDVSEYAIPTQCIFFLFVLFYFFFKLLVLVMCVSIATLFGCCCCCCCWFERIQTHTPTRIQSLFWQNNWYSHDTHKRAWTRGTPARQHTNTHTNVSSFVSSHILRKHWKTCSRGVWRLQ